MLVGGVWGRVGMAGCMGVGTGGVGIAGGLSLQLVAAGGVDMARGCGQSCREQN